MATPTQTQIPVDMLEAHIDRLLKRNDTLNRLAELPAKVDALSEGQNGSPRSK